MTDLSQLVVEVRANTSGFEADVAKMRSSFDGTVIDGFSRAGEVLERGLMGAIRRGNLGFDDLKRVALGVLEDIAAQSLRAGLGSIGLAGGGGGLNLGSLIGSIFGLPGRATGGPVAPGKGYLVGERGPELFVPTSSGRVEPNAGPGGARDVNISIRVVAPRGSSAPESLQRSSRQVAQAVKRALTEI